MTTSNIVLDQVNTLVIESGGPLELLLQKIIIL